MALTKLSTDGFKDDSVTDAKLANAINSAVAANTAKDLTALNASNLTSGTIPDARLPVTLPAISGANLTNLPASGKAHNLIINGAMQVAQRGTSSTTVGYQTVDRFNNNFGGTDEAITQAQVDVASGTTPYTLGFRKAFKLTNGNQTSGAGSADYVNISTKLEAQDIANSGWNYVSSSSSITLSFWVKSSVAQTMYARLNANDASKVFSFAISVTTSWQKITKTISGDSSLVFNNDNGSGLEIYFIPFYGTDYTTSGHTNDAWIADSGSDQVTDMTSTWYTTNDATFEITGVQLEVGSVATDFEHRSFGQELALSQRYHYVLDLGTNSASIHLPMMRRNSSSGAGLAIISFPVEMRNTPSFSFLGSARSSGGYSGDPVAQSATTSAAGIASTNSISASDIVNLKPYTPDEFLKLVFTAEL